MRRHRDRPSLGAFSQLFFSCRFRVVFESFSRLTRGEQLGRRAIDGIVAIGGIGVFLAGGDA